MTEPTNREIYTQVRYIGVLVSLLAAAQFYTVSVIAITTTVGFTGVSGAALTAGGLGAAILLLIVAYGAVEAGTARRIASALPGIDYSKPPIKEIDPAEEGRADGD